ncbi:MAG: alpha/beta fold hydrolase [Salegentibacter sp.]
MKKRYWFLLIFLAALLVTYFTGPGIQKPTYSKNLPDLPKDLKQLENYVQRTEAGFPVREDNHARIVWQEASAEVTEYSIVYLHGFAGSYRDGYPVNIHIADTLNANLYLSRWAGHGLKPPASLDNFSAETAWASAKEALMIGKRIGKKVIIMSTSTGGTLALKLAAAFPDSVYALINLSPNVKDDQKGSFVLNSPWGYEIAELVGVGKHKKISHEEELARHYWDTVYPSKALVDLQVLVASVMNRSTFKKIKCPVLTLYYHKNFWKEDEHVEISVYPEMYRKLSTPDSLKKLIPLDSPGTHFIGSDIKSKDTEVVEAEIVEFLRNTLSIEISSSE